MATQDMPKELGLFYIFFQTLPLYILWDQFITVQVTLPIPSHCLPLTVMLVFKSLCLKLLNIVILWTLKVVLGGHSTGYRKSCTIFRLRLSKSILTETKILGFKLYMVSQKRIYLNLSINILFVYLLTKYDEFRRKGS